MQIEKTTKITDGQRLPTDPSKPVGWSSDLQAAFWEGYRNALEGRINGTQEDYKQRFAVEYLDLAIRYEKLNRLVIYVQGGRELPFKLSCPVELLSEQLDAMKKYLDVLRRRAEIEDIQL